MQTSRTGGGSSSGRVPGRRRGPTGKIGVRSLVPQSTFFACILFANLGAVHAIATAAPDGTLDLVCQTENLERSCDVLPSVDSYRFVRTCVNSSLSSGGYVAFTDNYERASRVPGFCEGATPDQIRAAIVARGGAHVPRLLGMVSKLTFDSTSRFAALTGIQMPKGGNGAVPSQGVPGAVAMTPTVPHARQDAPPRVRSTGTGFVVGEGNVAVTNFHVVDGCSRIAAVVGDSSVEAKIVANDENSDLAAVRLAGAARPYLPLSTDTGELGAEIVVLGYPLTTLLGNDLRVTTGVVSALSGPRGERKLMQISAPVQPGNSGGPVLDRRAAVIGVVVSKLATRFSAENVNFAIRVPVLRSFLEINGVRFTTATHATPLRPADVARRGASAVVQLQCF